MRMLLISYMIAAIFTIAQTNSIAQAQNEVNDSLIVHSSGADIKAITTSGLQFNGELLSVRKNSLMILSPSTCRYNKRWWECVDQLKRTDIQKLIIKGNSYILTGLGIGTILGLVSIPITVDLNPGGFINIPRPRFSERTSINVFLGCIIVGGIIGLLNTTKDKVIEPFSEYEISGLSVYAKYPHGEPKILKQIE